MAYSYAQKLKDPRWQKVRLKVLERSNWQCEECGDSESTLHVHHGYYERGVDPWDYPANTLYCLCEGCHEYMQGLMRDCHYELARMFSGQLEEAAHFLKVFKYVWRELREARLSNDHKEVACGKETE